MKIREHNGIKYEVLKSWRPVHNRYRLLRRYTYKTGIVGHAFHTDYFSLLYDGTLIIYAGYEWDGPSGPTWDTKTFMRASLVHDPLYEALRKMLLPAWVKAHADVLLYFICIDDGMWGFRARYAYEAVAKAGAGSALPTKNEVKS